MTLSFVICFKVLVHHQILAGFIVAGAVVIIGIVLVVLAVVVIPIVLLRKGVNCKKKYMYNTKSVAENK